MGFTGERTRLKIIISDAGPIIHLHEADALNLILNMGEIFIPNAVYKEVKKYQVDIPSDFIVVSLNKIQIEKSKKYINPGNIHEGESEAIVLSQDLNADLLLTDDASARLFAEIKSINVRGSLGVVLWNYVHKKLTKEQAKKILYALKESSLWISNKIFHKALDVLEEK